MRTNIEINDDLMAKVMKSGQFATKRAAVEEGLRLLSQRDAGLGLLAMFGKVAWEGDLRAGRTSKERPRTPVAAKRNRAQQAAA